MSGVSSSPSWQWPGPLEAWRTGSRLGWGRLRRCAHPLPALVGALGGRQVGIVPRRWVPLTLRRGLLRKPLGWRGEQPMCTGTRHRIRSWGHGRACVGRGSLAQCVGWHWAVVLRLLTRSRALGRSTAARSLHVSAKVGAQRRLATGPWPCGVLAALPTPRPRDTETDRAVELREHLKQISRHHACLGTQDRLV